MRNTSRSPAFPNVVVLVHAAVLILAGATIAPAQVATNPNQIRGTIRFTNTSPEVLAILNAPDDVPTGRDEGFEEAEVDARSRPPSPSLSHTKDEASEGSTSTPYEITVEAGAPGEGIAYDVDVTMRMNDSDYYYFARQVSAPVEAVPAPPVELDFEECVALVHVTFVDGSGRPVTIPEIVVDVLAETQAGSGRFTQPRARSFEWDASEEWVAIRTDGTRQAVAATYEIGTDSCQDTARRTESVIIQPSCEQVIPFVVVVDPSQLGRVVGDVDMLGENEHRLPYGAGTMVRAFLGPFLNNRCDRLESVPSSGPFELPNLVESAAANPAEAYSVDASLGMRAGHSYEFYGSPVLDEGNGGGVLVVANQAVDLGDTFVMDPAFVRGDILLVGPPAEAIPSGPALADVWRSPDSDADGVPDSMRLDDTSVITRDTEPRGVYPQGPNSCISVRGAEAPATGATHSAHGAEARTLFAGAYDAVRGAFTGSFEAVVGGLDRAGAKWRPADLHVGVLDRATPADPASYHDFLVTVVPEGPAASVVELQPGDVATADQRYCFSELLVRFDAGAGAFNHPRLEGQGRFDGIDFEGHQARYRASLMHGDGLPGPDVPHATRGSVALALPRGFWTLTPSVVELDAGGGESVNELTDLVLRVGCRQVIEVSTGLLISVDDLPPCATDRVLTVTGDVTADLDVAEIAWSLNGEPEQLVCAPCGANPAFSFPVTLAACLNTIRVRARDVSGREGSVTSFTRFSGTTIALQGCADRTVERPHGAMGAVVTFDVTASDSCSEAVPVTCAPASGSLFPEGETTVACEAEDGCGARGTCSFVVSVTAPVAPPPVADAGPDRAACQATTVRIGGAPTASSGVPPYTYRWTPATGLDDATASNPRATLTGPVTYTVVVTDAAGASDDDSMSVTLLPAAPVAAFTAPTSLCEAQPACFTNISEGATSYEWQFGTAAGDASPEISPCFAFPAPGSYTVTLTAINACGRDTESRQVVVAPRPVARFTFDEGSGGGCVGRPVSFSDMSTENPTSWRWDFGDGTTSTERNPSHAYARDGVYVVSLVACNACGCSAPHFEAVAVAAACNTNCEANSNQIGCTGGAVVEQGDTCREHDNFNTTSYACAPGIFYSGENKIFDLNFLDGSNFVVRLVETEPEPNGYDLDVMISTACNPPECAAWGDEVVTYDDRTSANDDFWVIVDGRDGSCGPFRLEVECLPPSRTGSCRAPTFAGVARASDPDACAISGVLVEWAPTSSWGAGPTGATCAGGTYDLWRVDPGGREPELNVGSGLTGTSFVDRSAIPGRDYVYRVHAVNDCCGEPALTSATARAADGFTDPMTVTAGPDRVLGCDAPGGVRLFGSVTGGSGSGVEVSWLPLDAVSDPTTLSPFALRAGTYVLTVRDLASGCTVTDEVVVVGDPAAVAVEPSALDRGASEPLRVTFAQDSLALVSLSWEDVGSPEYRVFQGTLAELRAGVENHAAVACGIGTPATTLDMPRGAVYLLVASADCQGRVSSTGRRSDGLERAAPAACP